MMIELSMHVIDMVQNAIAAEAETVNITIHDLIEKDVIDIEIRDDGRGMTAEEIKKVQDPFYTTKKEKRIGLGIPLFKEAACSCGGTFEILSQIGIGTTIRAKFKKSHIDTPPLGDISCTLHVLMTTVAVNIDFRLFTDLGEFLISTWQIKEHIGDLPLFYPEVSRFLRDYIDQGIVCLYPH